MLNGVIVIFLISSVGTMIGATIKFIFFKNHIPELSKVAAMMSGSYIGGGVNFAAMADSFNIGVVKKYH